jgi:hypothetical protein
MKELIKPLTETISNRAKNPIIGSFTLAWLIHNFSAWTTLVFDDSTIYKERLVIFTQESFSNLVFYPILEGIGMYIFTLIISRLTILLSISQQKFTAQRSLELAKAENKVYKAKNEGKDYIELQEENQLLSTENKEYSEIKEKINNFLETTDIENLNTKELDTPLKEFKKERDEFVLFLKSLGSKNRISEDEIFKIRDLYDKLGMEHVKRSNISNSNLSSKKDQLNELINSLSKLNVHKNTSEQME